MKKRGLAVAALQDPRVGALLGLSEAELMREIRFLTDGNQFVGATAVLAVARELWWARPLVWVAILPGMSAVLHAGYGWVAKRRRCSASQHDRREADSLL